RDADAETLAVVAGEVRVFPIRREQLDEEFPLVDALIGAGLASSKADARRGIQAGGYTVNGERVNGEGPLSPNHLLAGRYIVLQKGKKHFAVVEVR
ncbi:MAG TPA: hypothetical protein VJK71_02465, partial [Gemmatimonadales bacterium]|nr:hypothetical protein [Gemmatimonadales bacterium]